MRTAGQNKRCHMKKLLLLLTALIFLAVSCSGSKKAENDADIDILPDEDVTDIDENDEDSEDEPDESSDTDEENPCDPNPCEGLERTTGECIASYDSEYDYSYYSCVCEDRYKYYWDYFEAKCTNACEGNPCANKEHSNGHCSLFDTPAAYECGCVEGYRWEYFDCVKDKNTCDNLENPCAGNPCKSDSNSNGTCIVIDEETYLCECNKNYKWSPGKLQCVRTCQDNPCSSYSNSDKQCYDDDVEGFYCGCNEPYFWNANSRKCTQNCDHNPCLNEANSTHECFPDEKNGYTCGCNDGYVWLRLDGCVTDFCKLDSCKNIPNSSGECRIVEEFGYLCECLNGTLWNPIEKNCGDEGFSFDWGTE